MSLNSKQKSLFQLATTELYVNETKKRVTARKWQKRVCIWCLRLVDFSLSYEKGLLQDSKEIKKLKGRKGEVAHSTLSIRCIKSDKHRQTNFNEDLDDFVVKKARTKPFLNCLLCSVQRYLIRW